MKMNNNLLFCNKKLNCRSQKKLWPNHARQPTRSTTILEFQKSNTQTILSGKAGQCVNQNIE